MGARDLSKMGWIFGFILFASYPLAAVDGPEHLGEHEEKVDDRGIDTGDRREDKAASYMSYTLSTGVFERAKGNRGPARSMASEDRHAILHSSAGAGSIVAVFDGHKPGGVSLPGAMVSDLAAKLFVPEKLLPLFEAGAPLSGDAFKHSVVAQFLTFDACVSGALRVGSTATVMFLANDELSIAWLGDSTAVLARGVGQAPLITKDHRATPGTAECQRVKDAGGRIVDTDRVGCGLGDDAGYAVSRAFGDYPKPAGLIAKPEILHAALTEKDEFAIVASDGLWDMVPPEHAVEIARDLFRQGRNAHEVAAALGRHAIEIEIDVELGRLNREALGPVALAGTPPGLPSRDQIRLTMPGDDVTIVVARLNWYPRKYSRYPLSDAERKYFPRAVALNTLSDAIDLVTRAHPAAIGLSQALAKAYEHIGHSKVDAARDELRGAERSLAREIPAALSAPVRRFLREALAQLELEGAHVDARRRGEREKLALEK